MKHRIVNTFTGPFAIIEHDDGSLRTTWLNDSISRRLAKSEHDRQLLPRLAERLMAYFEGDEDVDFADVETPADGGEFYQRCWEACRSIPRGDVRTYGQLAEMAGSSSSAARAAGQSMRHNPLPIIIPCHRVVASGGKLHGFAGSSDSDGCELGIKSALLTMEGALTGSGRSVLCAATR